MLSFHHIVDTVIRFPLWEKAALAVGILILLGLSVRLARFRRDQLRRNRMKAHYKETGNAYEFEASAIETEVIANLAAARPGQDFTIETSQFGQLEARGPYAPDAPTVDFLSAGKVAVDAFDALSKGSQLLKDLWKTLAGKPLLVIENRCDESPFRLGITKNKWSPANVVFFILKIDGKSRHMTINYTDKESNVTSSLKVDLQKVSPDYDNPTIHPKLGVNLTVELLDFVRKQMLSAQAMHSKTTIHPNEIVHTVFKLSETGNYIFYYYTDDSSRYYRCYHVSVKSHKDYSIIVEQKVDAIPKMSTVRMSDRVIA